MERKISLAIPTYERTELLFKSFKEVYDDERIDEIVIVDDCSSPEIFEEIRMFASTRDKIKLYRNAQNRDCYENKYTALSFAKNDWCILLDSDNVINDVNYVDRIFSLSEWDPKVVYMPELAAPLFDYRAFSGMYVSKENVAALMDQKMFDTMLNCANYFVNKNEYIKVWQPDIKPYTADSILQNYNWFNSGNRMLVVPGMQYYHRVHDGSHYQINVHKTGNLYNEIVEKLKFLC